VRDRFGEGRLIGVPVLLVTADYVRKRLRTLFVPPIFENTFYFKLPANYQGICYL
jgi:hypothetical protein